MVETMTTMVCPSQMQNEKLDTSENGKCTNEKLNEKLNDSGNGKSEKIAYRDKLKTEEQESEKISLEEIKNNDAEQKSIAQTDLFRLWTGQEDMGVGFQTFKISTHTMMTILPTEETLQGVKGKQCVDLHRTQADSDQTLLISQSNPKAFSLWSTQEVWMDSLLVRNSLWVSKTARARLNTQVKDSVEEV
jgi:hypothetical protein